MSKPKLYFWPSYVDKCHLCQQIIIFMTCLLCLLYLNQTVFFLHTIILLRIFYNVVLNFAFIQVLNKNGSYLVATFLILFAECCTIHLYLPSIKKLRHAIIDELGNLNEWQNWLLRKWQKQPVIHKRVSCARITFA